MTDRPWRPPPELVARIRTLAERVLTREEVAAARATPMSPAEMAEKRELIRWFRRRYPTPRERLAWARAAHLRWRRASSSTRREAAVEASGRA